MEGKRQGAADKLNYNRRGKGFYCENGHLSAECRGGGN